MLSTKRLLATLCLLAAASAAHSVVIINWKGDCTGGCVGTANATITMANTYTLGTTTENLSDFISFSFTSSTLNLSLAKADVCAAPYPCAPGVPNYLFRIAPFGSVINQIAAKLPSPATFWSASADGSWRARNGATSTTASGTGSMAAAVPEPAGLALLGLGLIGLVVMRRKLS